MFGQNVIHKYVTKALARILDLCDDELIHAVLIQAIERLQEAVRQTETNVDDMVILPLLSMVQKEILERALQRRSEADLEIIRAHERYERGTNIDAAWETPKNR